MKKILFVLFGTFLLVSCANDDNNASTNEAELVGEWLLKEVYADPGDGSGDYVSVESNKTLEFNSNGIVISNHNICYFTSTIDEVGAFEYNFDESTNLISGLECNTFTVSSLSFVLDESQDLILSYPCIEGCLMKFEKVD